MGGVSIQNKTRRRTASRLIFSKIANDVLRGWQISLAFVGATEARKLNKQLRGKSYVPNVLSYSLGDKDAEIIICLSEAKRQAPSYEMSEQVFITYLFIHGVLHIKGWAHGAKMDEWEKKLLARYEASYSHRHRHRDVPGKDGRRRRALG